MAAKKERITSEKIYNLLVEEVVPVKEDIAKLDQKVENLNGSFEKRCKFVDGELDKHETRMDKLDDNKIDKRPIIILGVILGLLVTFLNVFQIIEGVKTLFGS
jgi:tetrahydromethanopterin S-methyltransferase subunit B